MEEFTENPVRDIMNDVFPVSTREIPMIVITNLLHFLAAVLVTEKGKIDGTIAKADLFKALR